MAHFAEIDENNIVQRVIVIDNEQEHRGQEFIANDLGLGGRWIQTSYNGNFRKQYAGPGFYYDETKDIFVSIKPYESWILDDNSDWKAPIEMPNDLCYWDEETLSWINNKF